MKNNKKWLIASSRAMLITLVLFLLITTTAGQAETEKNLPYPHMSANLNRLLTNTEPVTTINSENFCVKQKSDIRDGKIDLILELNVNRLPSRQTGGKESLEAAVQRVTQEVKTGVEALGGIIRHCYGSMMHCRIDIRALENLAQLENIESIRLAEKMHPHVVTEGVSKTGANFYHGLAPFHSDGAKVCVIDGGFVNYNRLLGDELPQTVTTRSFRDDNDFEADSVHGTACAEIIHDMAPDAQLFLGTILYTVDLIDAVQWAITQNVDIISHSMGSYFGPGNGTGMENELAIAAKNAGITWINSAGNSADDHWSGTFYDPDNNGWHNFTTADEMLTFQATAALSQAYGINAILKWDDWGSYNSNTGFAGSSNNYDLYLYIWTGREWQQVDVANNSQPTYKWPYEDTNFFESTADATWGIKIKKVSANRNVKFDLFIPTHNRGTLEYNTPAGSLTLPADSPNLYSVGAVDVADDSYHYYSSQGPTADGRIKPDFCAPSGVSSSTSTYGARNTTGGFNGTSASCPHVAGAVALLKDKTPFTLTQIIQILKGRAVDLGTTGPDSKYGNGRLNLDY